ncbi:universal stress protein [Halobacterium jilantaiense]|uniref:Nucleotide-binding universal stress protein, UspA family n=1 Tax=Halobacterium jilantaiense TaxID=355548 RepID=A0A1I0QD98_9EURY|nr:universal stress protein [Halobacterium jilantaiense]SEW25032.1 Nucleotide-binding universal stress protein, UspA family [Halobacterium jilantaiense]
MYDRILLPTDGHESMERVVDHAADIAARRDATVDVLYVVDDRAFLTLDDGMQDEATAQLHEQGEAAVSQTTERLEDAGVTVTTDVREGDPAEEILGALDDGHTDLVVMGTRRGEFEQSMLGSVSRQVVESTETPVLTVPVADE